MSDSAQREPSTEERLARQSWDLWQRARSCIAESTERSLSEAIELIESAARLVSVSNLRAMLYHDLAIAHWRLAKRGHVGNTSSAIAAALQACLLDVNSMLQEGHIDDLERDADLLSSILPTEGVTPRDLHDTQILLDRYFTLPLADSSLTRIHLQANVAAAYLSIAEGTNGQSLRSGMGAVARDACKKAIGLVNTLPRPELHGQYRYVYVNEVLLTILESQTITQFHLALDHAFEVDRHLHTGATPGSGEELTIRAGVAHLLQKQATLLLGTLDRARLRNRLWTEWGMEWLKSLEANTDNPSSRTEVQDWIIMLMQAEQEEMLGAAANAPSDRKHIAIPNEAKEYAFLLLTSAGYSPLLLVVCAGLAFSIDQVNAEMLLPEPFKFIYQEHRDSFYGLLNTYRAISMAIMAGQRENASCIRDLRTAVTALSRAERTPITAHLKKVAAAAALEIAGTVDDGDLALNTLKIGREILSIYGDLPATELELLAAGVTLSLRWASTSQQRWQEETLDWATALVSAIEERISSSDNQDPEHLGLLYRRTWAVLHLAKAQAFFDSDLATQTLGSGVELASKFEREAHGDPVALVLKAEILRTEAQLAIVREGYETAFFKFADEMRLMVEHPELNFGPALLTAINLLINALNMTPRQLATAEDVIRAASSMVMRNIPATMASGRGGLDAIAALSSVGLRDIAGLSDQDTANLARLMQLHPDLPLSLLHTIDPRAVLALNPFDMTLTEAFRWYAHLIEQQHAVPAVMLLLQWLGANIDRPIFGQRAHLIHHGIALELATLASHIPEFPREMKHFANYIVGETARFAHLWDVAEHWLGTVYRDPETVGSAGTLLTTATASALSMGLTWHDAVECDYGGVMVVISCREGQREIARRWLEIIDRNTRSREASGSLAFAAALGIYVKTFGPEDVSDELANVVRRLSGESRPGPRPSLEEEANHLVAAVELGTLFGQAALLEQVEHRVQLTLQRHLPSRLEAALRRARVESLIALDRIAELRPELERLTFLQDVEAGSVTAFDVVSYEDLPGKSSIRIAWAALALEEPALALDALERGRLRVLLRLKEDAEMAHQASRDSALTPQVENAPRAGECLEEEHAASGNGPQVIRGSDGTYLDLLRPVYAYRAVGSHAERFAIPSEAWERVFRDLHVVDIIDAAKQTGILAYQIVHQARLRMLFVIGNQLALTDVVEVPRVSMFDDMMYPVFQSIQGAWQRALLTWQETGGTKDRLSPVLISIGERAELAWLSEIVVGELMMSMDIVAEDDYERGLTQAPSVRLLDSWHSGPRKTKYDHKLLHIGDLSNTLIGPWLESATLASVPELEMIASVVTGDLAIDEFRTLASEASIIVASCHGSYSSAGLVGTSLGIGNEGLSVVDIVGSGTATEIEMLFLAACEMGRRAEEVHERESVSFANAALIGGCKYVVAPSLPVNDLVSAVLVSVFCRRLPSLGSVGAYRTALRSVQTMTAQEFRDTVRGMWHRLRDSELSEVMPWPASAVGNVIDRRVDEAVARRAWLYVPFTISRGSI